MALKVLNSLWCPYISVNIGKGNMERERQQQQEAYLFAGNQLAFTSGRDGKIAGATSRGNEVVGRVGHDLTFLKKFLTTWSLTHEDF